MKLIKSIITFFTDDFATGAMVILWIVAAMVAGRVVHLVVALSAVFVAGMIAILSFSVWRKSKPAK